MEQDMRYIHQIYKDGSFSKAADHLFMTQPALSLAVKRVESTLGAEIFERGSRPLTLTEVGRAYLAAIDRIQKLEDELASQIHDLRSLETGTLYIGGTHYLNNYILAPVLAAFACKYPGIQLVVSENSSAELAKALKQNALDVILSCDEDMLENFQHIPAFYDHMLLAVHKSVPLSDFLAGAALSATDIMEGKHTAPNCRSVPLELFRDMQFILLQSGNNLYNRSRQMFADAGFDPKVKMSLAQMVTAYRFADNGLGAAFISDRLVRSNRSNLVFFKINSPLVTRLFYFLLPDRNYTAFAVKAFLQFADKSGLHLDVKA